MPHRKAQNPHSPVFFCNAGHALAFWVPEKLNVEGIGRYDRDSMPGENKSLRDLGQVSLCPTNGWPVTLADMKNVHYLIIDGSIVL